jgi:hypothetical protein
MTRWFSSSGGGRVCRYKAGHPPTGVGGGILLEDRQKRAASSRRASGRRQPLKQGDGPWQERETFSMDPTGLPANENLLGSCLTKPREGKRSGGLAQREVQRRRRRCWALRLYFSVGVSWWRSRLRSAKIPAFETCRLNRRRADSIPSFSPTVTWVIKGGQDHKQPTNLAKAPIP